MQLLQGLSVSNFNFIYERGCKNMIQFSQFKPIMTEYLSRKGIENEGVQDEILHLVLDESYDSEPLPEYDREVLNLLLYKDIVVGLWNGTTTIEQSLYQLVNVVDLYLALKGYLYATMDSQKVSANFKKVSQKIDTLENEDEFQAFVNFVQTDKTWIPIQKEYRDIYVFLLINMVHLLYFDEGYEGELM